MTSTEPHSVGSNILEAPLVIEAESSVPQQQNRVQSKTRRQQVSSPLVTSVLQPPYSEQATKLN